MLLPARPEEVFAKPEQQVLAQSRKQCGGLIDDVVKELSWWACFTPPSASRPELDEPFPTLADRYGYGTVVRSEPKIGRNAPCPCGSGKKHKKCCGA
jgi:hypothetical protein